MKKALLISLMIIATSFILTAEKTKVEVLKKSSSCWDGTVLKEYPKGQPEISILKITVPPHTALPVHKHPVINAGVLLKGKLTVKTKEGKILKVKAGDAVVEVVNKWHYGKNESDEPAVILVVYAGVKGKPISINKK